MKASILIVDDEPGIRDMLSWELSSHGYDVTAAHDGAQAIEKVRQTEFDLIISDIRMPGMSGLEVLKAAKELAPDTEIIVATGFAELDNAVECVRGGAFDFIQKPFQTADLLVTVARALERRQLRAQTALYEASRAIFSSDERQRLPEVIVDVSMKVMAADDVSLMLPDADGRLYIAHSHFLSPEVSAEVRIAIGERVVGRIVKAGDAVLLQNGISQDPRFSDIRSFDRVRSSIIYPLLTAGRLVGVLNINRFSNKSPFRNQDLERASVLASQILLALENVRLLRQVVTSEKLASVGLLAAGVAHEINNPTACVLSNHAYLTDRLAALAELDSLFASGADAYTLRQAWNAAGGHAFLAEARDALVDLGEGATRIRDIARDLKSLARSDTGKPSLFDLNEPIQSALRITSAEVRHRSTVTVRLGRDVEILGNAGRLSQLFVNLLINAAQAFGERPAKSNEIVVTSEREGDRVVARVSDNGSGIRPEHLARMFETFFTTKGPDTGTGLGLSISREIVRSHGGEIRVESVLGRGTTFTIVLPFAGSAAATAAPIPTRQEEDKKLDPRRARILFVDDEHTILAAYERAFGQHNDVVVAEDGERALSILAQRNDFNLIVCDLLMPNMTGMEFYRRAVEVYPKLDGAFVFVTGGVTQHEVQAFLRTVGNQILEKPFDFLALRQILAVRQST